MVSNKMTPCVNRVNILYCMDSWCDPYFINIKIQVQLLDIDVDALWNHRAGPYAHDPLILHLPYLQYSTRNEKCASRIEQRKIHNEKKWEPYKEWLEIYEKERHDDYSKIPWLK